MSEKCIDKLFLENHLHQLRTTLSVIDISCDSLSKKLPNDQNLNLIKSSLKLVEVSYDSLLFISNFEYIKNQDQEECEVAKVLNERFAEFAISSQVYLVKFVIVLKKDVVMLCNDNFLKRIIDDIIVYIIKNSIQNSDVEVSIDEQQIEFKFQSKNQSKIFNETTKKILELIEINSNFVIQNFCENKYNKIKIKF